MEIVLDHHIEITPDVRGGRPHIAGTRITVADIVIMHLRLGQSLEEKKSLASTIWIWPVCTLLWLITTTIAQRLMGASKRTKPL